LVAPMPADWTLGPQAPPVVTTNANQLNSTNRSKRICLSTRSY